MKGDWAKCCYCGKEYQITSEWHDDGFCCGRCRHLAKERQISGHSTKLTKLVFRIIIGIILLYVIVAMIFGNGSGKKKKLTKSETTTEEVIKDNGNSRDAVSTKNFDMANTDNNENSESSSTEEKTETQAEEDFVPIGGQPDPEPATNESASEEPAVQTEGAE